MCVRQRCRTSSSDAVAPSGRVRRHHEPSWAAVGTGCMGSVGPVKVEAAELLTVELPLVTPFRTSYATSRRRAQAARPPADRRRHRLGGVRRAGRAALHERVRRRRPPRPRPPPAAEGGRSGPGRHGRNLVDRAGADHGPPDGQGRAGDGRAGRAAAGHGQSLAGYFGATRTGCRRGSRSASSRRSPPLLDVVGDYLAQGYVRIKLKIKPGWDVAPVRAVREQFGDDLIPLQVDANAAYTLADARAAPAGRVRPAADRAAAAEDDSASTPNWPG